MWGWVGLDGRPYGILVLRGVIPDGGIRAFYGTT